LFALFVIALQDLGDRSQEASGRFLSARPVKLLIRSTFWSGVSSWVGEGGPKGGPKVAAAGCRKRARRGIGAYW
jgi:hypothetical protein